MSHYAIFFIGLFIGTLLGLFLAGLLGMAHRGEREQEIMDAYLNGFDMGRAKPGETLREGE